MGHASHQVLRLGASLQFQNQRVTRGRTEEFERKEISGRVVRLLLGVYARAYIDSDFCDICLDGAYANGR